MVFFVCLGLVFVLTRLKYKKGKCEISQGQMTKDSWTLKPSKSDQHLISPYNIIPESNIKVRRIKEMITYQRSSWSLKKFSLSAT